ncbi:hypothetical protein ACFL9T_11830 [Thermodesulfobacteriota bacterium]
MAKKGWVLILGFFLMLSLSENAFCYRLTTETSTLDGLKSIFVRISPVSPELEEKGLVGKDLKRNIEDQLKGAKITVLIENEFERLRRSDRYPLAVLDLAFVVFEVDSRIIYFVNLRVLQLVQVTRKGVIKLFAPTWEKREMGAINNLKEIENIISGVVDLFIDDFYSSNPSK